jgi:hypothetical protein
LLNEKLSVAMQTKKITGGMMRKYGNILIGEQM